jgi:membrane-associated HD superfamily phosphohydrolase
MPQTKSDTTKFLRIRSGVMNIFYFIVSIAAVVTIITYNEEASKLEITGTIIVVAACYIILYFFLLEFRREVLEVPRKILFILIIILLFLFIARVISPLPGRNLIFFVPFAIIPVMVRTFYDARLALFILLITIMQAAFMVPRPFEFVLMSFISGMVAIFTLTNIYRRLRLLYTAFMVILSYSGLYMGIWLTNGGNFHTIAWSDFYKFAGNGALVLVCYPLTYKNISDIKDIFRKRLSNIYHARIAYPERT